MPIRVIQSECLLKGQLRRHKLAEIKQSESKRSLCLQQKIDIIRQFRPVDQTQAELVRPVELTSDNAKHHETVEGSKEQVMLTEPLAQFASSGEHCFDLWGRIALRCEKLGAVIDF
jgi:hypothetical protein